MNRAYSRCRMACSTPPTYWSTRRPLLRLRLGRTPSCRRSATGSAGSTRSCPRRCPSCPRRAVAGVPSSGFGHVRPSRRRPRAATDRAASGPGRRSAAARSAAGPPGTGIRVAVLAVDDRDGCAPEALAADQPVAQPEGPRGAAGARLLEQLDDALDRVLLARGRPADRS